MPQSDRPFPEIDPSTKIIANYPSFQPHLLFMKRKRDDGASGDLSVEKAVKKKETRRSRSGGDEYHDVEQGLNNAIGRFDEPLLADYVAQREKRFGQDLSSVEIEDRYIPAKAFVDTSRWGKPRLLSNLPDFLDQFCTKHGKTTNMSSSSKKNGAPHTIVVTSAGLRAADIIRVLRMFQTKEAMVAKLFAKHIKLSDAIDYVQNSRIGIGVGTPSRINDLLNAGALLTEHVERIVVDCSHVDQKKRGILDMRETQQPLMQLLNRHDIKHRYGSIDCGINLLFY